MRSMQSSENGTNGIRKGVIQYLINVVERILLVDDRIQKDPKGPDVLFLAAVGFALKNFGRGIVWICISWLCG